MPGTITRDGRILTMPDFTQQQKDDMVQAVARAMVNLGREKIQEAVSDYLRKTEVSAG